MQAAAGYLRGIESFWLSETMRNSLWLYPIVEIVHILGFVILVGAVIMFDLRVLGLSKALPVQRLGRHLLRWSLLGFVVIVPSGLMMFSAHPQEFIQNRIFLFKLCLIATGGINAAIFHTNTYRTVEQWDTLVEAPGAAKAHALISIAVWVAVISCGRLLAYT